MAFTAQRLLTFFAKGANGKLTSVPGSTIGASAVPTYTVAGLPSGVAGAVAFATNCCAFTGATNGGSMVRENPGAGTGALVTHNGTAWKIAGTNVTASA